MERPLWFATNFKRDIKYTRSGRMMSILTMGEKRGTVQQANVYAFKQTKTNNELIYQTKDLSLWYGKEQALKNINMSIHDKAVTAIIGPSGCGKSTYLKTLTRMVELVPSVHMEGEIAYKGKNILDKTFRSDELSTVIGMVFQKAYTFTISIYETVTNVPTLNVII